MRPRRARDVLAARNPSVFQPSSIGSSGRPTPRIWKKWSMTQIESNPTSSAWRATRARDGPTAAAPPGHVYEGICRPLFIELGLRDPDRASPWASGSAPVIEALVAGCYSHLSTARSNRSQVERPLVMLSLVTVTLRGLGSRRRAGRCAGRRLERWLSRGSCCRADDRRRGAD